VRSADKKFYISLPYPSNDPNGEVDEIDPKMMRVFPIATPSCGPAG